MQTQKLDTKRPYGTVYGHAEASYEQDGKLFDGGGDVLEQTTRIDTVRVDVDPVEWLSTLLAGGAVSQPTIVKQADIVGLSWHSVSNAGNKLNVNKYKQPGSNTNYWKLMPDAVPAGVE